MGPHYAAFSKSVRKALRTSVSMVPLLFLLMSVSVRIGGLDLTCLHDTHAAIFLANAALVLPFAFDFL
jgi:hypothetical protein